MISYFSVLLSVLLSVRMFECNTRVCSLVFFSEILRNDFTEKRNRIGVSKKILFALNWTKSPKWVQNKVFWSFIKFCDYALLEVT